MTDLGAFLVASTQPVGVGEAPLPTSYPKREGPVILKHKITKRASETGS